jgi:hypothetical protein
MGEQAPSKALLGKDGIGGFEILQVSTTPSRTNTLDGAFDETGPEAVGASF